MLLRRSGCGREDAGCTEDQAMGLGVAPAAGSALRRGSGSPRSPSGYSALVWVEQTPLPLGHAQPHRASSPSLS